MTCGKKDRGYLDKPISNGHPANRQARLLKGAACRERGQKEKKVSKLEHTKPGGDSDPSFEVTTNGGKMS